MGDFGLLLKSRKNKNYILKLFNDEEFFLNYLIDYMEELINKRYSLSREEIDNFVLYISYFNCNEIVLNKLSKISKRCRELKGSLNKEQKRLYDLAAVKIGDLLNEMNFDTSQKNLELITLGNTIDEIINHNNPIIFELLNDSKLVKFKYHDGQLLIDKVYKKFVTLLQSKDFYNESLEYLRQVIFVILSFNKKSNKIDKIIANLDDIKKHLNNEEQGSILMELKNELYLLRDGKLPSKNQEQSSKIIERYYDIKVNFSSEALEECNCLKSSRYNGIKKINDYKYFEESIKDFRDKRIITMDSHFKSAYDDAISLEKTDYGYLLGIYITDVASFIDINSCLGTHAKQRCESIYLSEANKGSLTMFPKDITRNFFSLNSHSDKQVVAYLFKFSSSYDLIDYEFTNAIINVNSNYTFDSIDKLSLSDTNYDMIYDLIKITDSLKKNHNQDYHRIKEKLKHINNIGIGSSIVSTSSIFLNSYIASLFKKRGYPLIYRVNDSVLNDDITNSNLEKLVKGYSKSYYSSVPGSHIIANGPYCHITNPIRNYPSFVNQCFFERLFLDYAPFSETCSFLRYWNEVLPNLVDEINKRMDMNSNYVKVMKNIKK